MLFNAAVSLKARRSAASLLPQGEGGLRRPALVSEAAGEASHCFTAEKRSFDAPHPTPPPAGKDVQLLYLMLGWKVTARKPEELAAVRCPAPVSPARQSRPAGLHPERGDPSAPARSLGRRARGLAGTWRAGLGRSRAHPSRKDDGTSPRSGAAAGGKGACLSFSSCGSPPAWGAWDPACARRSSLSSSGGASPGGSFRLGDRGAGEALLE
ncbi:uncharacterized protein LOC128059616 [Budorcas taxicolor]|uniref:uncharacterized protein LOC128059616 n=1 Tax=Budorcas taxicolor TaxID=37181 RepID=UPI00228444AC|nr:uncharacterized protein LOC128059616 [Budorcas taxicolor]